MRTRLPCLAISSVAFLFSAAVPLLGEAFSPPTPEAWIENFNIYAPNYAMSYPFTDSTTTGLSEAYTGPADQGISGSITGGNAPSLYMNAYANSTGTPNVDTGLWAGGDVGVYYYYMAYDPSDSGSNISVPIDISFNSGLTENTSGYGAYAAGGLLEFRGGLQNVSGGADVGGTYEFGFDYENSVYNGGLWPPTPGTPNTLGGQGSITATVDDNTWYEVYMRISALALGDYIPSGGAGSASVSDYLDPTISIDSSFIGDPGTEIIYSTLAASETPEPVSVFLLGSGLFAVGCRRRKAESR
jgi:hypothetical protein